MGSAPRSRWECTSLASLAVSLPVCHWDLWVTLGCSHCPQSAFLPGTHQCPAHGHLALSGLLCCHILPGRELRGDRCSVFTPSCCGARLLVYSKPRWMGTQFWTQGPGVRARPLGGFLWGRSNCELTGLSGTFQAESLSPAFPVSRGHPLAYPQ